MSKKRRVEQTSTCAKYMAGRQWGMILSRGCETTCTRAHEIHLALISDVVLTMPEKAGLQG